MLYQHLHQHIRGTQSGVLAIVEDDEVLGHDVEGPHSLWILGLGGVSLEVDAGVDTLDIIESGSFKLSFGIIGIRDEPIGEEHLFPIGWRVEVLAEGGDGLDGLRFS